MQEMTMAVCGQVIDRRGFVRSGAVIGGGLIGLPSAVFGANERLNVACVGVGGQGRSEVNGMKDENIVAMCDVDEARAAGSFKAYPKARRFKDFRRLLDAMGDEIDAVTVTTPDHMHFPIAMAAISAGKHVFVQKPMAHTVWEARELTKAAKAAGVATQMGIQGHAGEGTRRIKEWIDDGAIGEVREVHCWTEKPNRVWRQGVDRPSGTPQVPGTLDWNLWLGVAPERPYHPDYLPFSWRGWWDFGSCAMGDMGCHVLDHPVTALELGAPHMLEAYSSPINKETGPISSIIHFYFRERGTRPPVHLTWYDGGMMPQWPGDLHTEMRRGNNEGVMFVGDKGKLMCGCYGNAPRLLPESLHKSYEKPRPRIPRSIGHHAEWIRACKGGPPAGANFDFSGPLTETVQLGNVAIRAAAARHKRNGYDVRMQWDSERLTSPNVPEAEQFVRQAHRAF
jgi:hypothetical protein